MELTLSVRTKVHVLKAQSNGVLARRYTLVFLKECLIQALFSSAPSSYLAGENKGVALPVAGRKSRWP